MKNLFKNIGLLFFLLIAVEARAQQDLKIISPNGGEEFVVGTDVDIRWQGVPPQKFVILDYSTDNGVNWKRITDKATGLKHTWKVPNDASKQCQLRANLVNGATPAEWAMNVPVNIKSLKYDSQGNIYTCGYFFKKSIDFGKGVIINEVGKNDSMNTSTGDIFIAKYDYYGEIIWAKSFGGNYRDEALDLDVDTAGNLYFTGLLSDTLVNFGNGVVVRAPSFYGKYYFFTAKLNSDGIMQWAQPIKGENSFKDELDVHISVDKLWHVIVSGQAHLTRNDTLDFGKGNFITRPRGGSSNQHLPFIAKYDNNGNIQWVTGFNGYGTFSCVTTDTNGNIYVCGMQAGKLDFNNNVSSDTTRSFFLSKYSPTGSALWVRNIGITKNNSGYGYYPTGITVDRFNNIYFTGRFHSAELNFGNGVVLTSIDPDVNITGEELFLARYTTEGNAVWAIQSHRSIWGSQSGLYPVSLTTDYFGNIIIAGIFESRSVDFGNSITLELTNANRQWPKGDIFLIKYDNSGRTLWAKKAIGDEGDYLNDIAIDPYGSIIITGWFRSESLEFNPNYKLVGPKDDLKESSYYLAKYDNEIPVGTQDISDNTWTINKPEFSALNINMGKVLLGMQKDSIVTAFIRNEGIFPVDIRDIQLSGTQASEFQILTGKPPFIIPVDSVATVQFRFTPAAIGLRQANLAIITPIDNLYQNIEGEGIQPLISIAASLVNMGVVEIGSQKDTILTAIVENIGNAPLKITNTTLSSAGKYAYSLLNPQSNFILEAGAKQNIQLRFSPQTIGQVDAELQFSYEGMTSGPAVAQITGFGIGGSLYVDDVSAYAGESRFLKINLSKLAAHNLLQQKPVSFTAKVSYGNSIIAPSVNASGVIISNDDATGTLDISAKWDGTSTELAQIPFTATLGDRTETLLELLSFHWLNDAGEIVNYETELQNGVFKILGICEEGGTRLYDKDGTAQMMILAPHPANGVVAITFETVERGATTLMLTDALGQQTVLKSGDFEKGSHSFEFDTQQLAAGIYILTMQTPTQVFTQQVIIGR